MAGGNNNSNNNNQRSLLGGSRAEPSQQQKRRQSTNQSISPRRTKRHLRSMTTGGTPNTQSCAEEVLDDWAKKKDCSATDVVFDADEEEFGSSGCCKDGGQSKKETERERRK